MYDATQILAEQGVMETSRANFEALWHEVAKLLLPRQADFLEISSGFTQGRARTERIFDETALQSLDHGCAVFEGEVIPQGGQWQRLVPRDEDLLKKRHVALWYEKLGDKLFALRNSPYSGFANQTHESVASLLSFGFQSTWTDLRRDATGRPIGIAYHSEHIGQIFIREDHTGAVETSHKKFRLSHRKALSKWGDSAPSIARKAAEDSTGKKLDEEANYIHRLAPNPHYDPDRIDWRGKPFASCYLCVDTREVFDLGGYRTRPRTCSRYEKSPMEDYGRAPGINVLPAIRACQRIIADLVTAIEFMAKPMLGAHDDMLDQLIMYQPGGVTYGAIDDRGNPLIRTLWENSDIAPALQLLQETRTVIKRAFFEDLYIIRQELKSHISAAEQMLRDQQRGILLAPLKRQESEWFTPQTERELDLMNEMDMLADMPQEVRDSGGLYGIVYENPLARARQAEAAGGFYQMLGGVSPLMQLDPNGTVPAFFRRFPFERVLDGLSRIHGVPASWGASEDEQNAAAEDAQALADKASLLEVGERAAGIVKDLSAASPPPSQGGAGGL